MRMMHEKASSEVHQKDAGSIPENDDIDRVLLERTAFGIAVNIILNGYSGSLVPRERGCEKVQKDEYVR